MSVHIHVCLCAYICTYVCIFSWQRDKRGVIKSLTMMNPTIEDNWSFLLCSVAQSCLTLWGPMDCSPPGSSVHGILQEKILEWGAISYSGGVFPTQGSKPCLLHLRLWQADSLPLVPPVKPLSDLSLANVCFYSVGCLFILLMISFAVQKLF